MFDKFKQYFATALILLFVVMVSSISAGTVDASSTKTIYKISSKTVNLKENKTKKLKLKKNGKVISKKIKWKTSNKKVATISSSGKIKAKKMGYALITATYNKHKYFCLVHVSKRISQTHTHTWSTRTVTDQEAYDEQVCAKEAYDEKVLVKDAWDEQVPEYDYEDSVRYYCLKCNTEMSEHGDCPNCGYGCCWCETCRNQVLVGYTTVHHDAEYKTVHHDAEYTTKHHDAVTHTETYCSECGATK